MKRIVCIIAVLCLITVAIFAIPTSSAVANDGGTRVYTALGYKLVFWKRITADGLYEKTRIYFGGEREMSLDELWLRERAEPENRAPYEGEWLDRSCAERYEDQKVFGDVIITEIYSDCFFAVPAIPMGYTIKLNGVLADEWCVGDQVECTYENVYYDDAAGRMECDFLSVKEGTWQPQPGVAYKPVIYLYPEEETEVSVRLGLDGELICTYPEYNSGWAVTASPDGTLTDSEGQTYSYLYWEGELNTEYDLSRGFCVRGEDTADFLEWALAELGLNRREANEFIVFWLPMMQSNRYNVISFREDDYTDAAELEIAPTPDTVIRVFMAWRPSDIHVDIPEQELTAPEREGFTAVEWGGCRVE